MFLLPIIIPHPPSLKVAISSLYTRMSKTRPLTRKIQISQGDKTTSGANDIIIYTPGGGVGPVYDGCRQQYGKSW